MEKQIQISEKLQKARDYEKAELERRSNIARPEFHVCAPVGWMNDPNGFSEYQGEIHLFFQYHPYDTVWGPMHWGHVKTKDFIAWDLLPIVLAPDEKYDGFGCFSGSAIEWNGKHVIAYTGVERKKEANGEIKDYQTQCIAVGNGLNYEKKDLNPVIPSEMVPKGSSMLDFRDPKIWIDTDGIYMVVGNRAEDGSGQILMYKTINLDQWEFVSILDQCKNRYGKMWECPDFFAMEDYHVLIVSPQEMEAKGENIHPGDGTICILGHYDKLKKKLIEDSVSPVDMGFDFYAPQTMKTSDGRRIMIAWMQDWCACWFGAEDGFCGMMTIPRELFIKENRLYQLPVRELENYYENYVELKNVLPKEKMEKYESISGRIMNLELELESDADYEFEIRIAADEKYYTSILYEKAKQRLTLDRSHSGTRRDTAHTRSIRVLGNGTKVKLRMIMDRYSVEVFINDGEQAMTTIIKTPMKADGIYMKSVGNLKVNITKNDIKVNEKALTLLKIQ